MTDALNDGRRFCIPVVVDDFSRECLALVDSSISGHRVTRELDRLIEQRAKPAIVVGDPKPFIGGRSLPACDPALVRVPASAGMTSRPAGSS